MRRRKEDWEFQVVGQEGEARRNNKRAKKASLIKCHLSKALWEVRGLGIRYLRGGVVLSGFNWYLFPNHLQCSRQLA